MRVNERVGRVVATATMIMAATPALAAIHNPSTEGEMAGRVTSLLLRGAGIGLVVLAIAAALYGLRQLHKGG